MPHGVGPRVSVIICAYTEDRWDDLVAAVDSVRLQSFPAAETLVVIDHNPELLARAQAKIAGGLVRVLPSTQPRGLSGARNTGVEAASGEIVAFLDDDALAEPDWLGNLVAPYADEDVVAVGGRIAASWDRERPGWFPAEFDWVIGCSYRGMPEERGPVRNVIGANMSFRREALLAAGGFAAELGRTASQALGDEETEACIRVRQVRPGAVVLYEPKAGVSHRVPPSRGTWRYFSKRCFGEGVSKSRLTGRVGGRDGLASERRHVLRTLPSGAIREAAATLGGKDRAGLARSAAIVAGLAVTVGGYAAGTLARGWKAVRSALAPADLEADEPATGRLRVLMVTPRFPPLMGGVEHHVLQVARRMADDADVLVLTTDPSGKLPREEVVEGVHVRRVRAWPKRKDFYIAPGLWRAITHGRWDVVHVQSYHTAVAPLAMLAALSAGIPYVVTFHGGGHSSAFRRKMRGLQWRLLRPLLARAEKLIAVARFEADFFAERLHIPAERFSVIPNGSDLPRPERLPPRSEDDGPLLVSIGRLEHYKGHHRVIEALPWVLSAFPNARLLVLGSGPYRDELEQLALQLGVASRVAVRSIPSADRQQMATTLAGADLVVLMSEFETHPLAVIEALALGRPALVADTSGLRELAEEGLARAIPVDSGARTIGAAIVEDLRHPRPVPAVSLPTWDQCARRVLQVYRQSLGTSAEAPTSVRGRRRLPLVAGLASCGMITVAFADNAGRAGSTLAMPLFWAGLLLIFAPAAAALMSRKVTRGEALGVVLVLGMALYVVNVLDSPTLFTGFDELLHYRTLVDVARTGRVFNENPLLPISPFFPGLEILTFAVMSLTGMSGFASGVVVVGVARLIALLSLFVLLERVGLRPRSAGVGVLMFVTVPSFLFFQAQFAYESLALPLAVLVLLVLRESQLAPAVLRRRLPAVAALMVFAVAVTHHVTSYILTMALLAWLLIALVFHRRSAEPLPGGGWVPLFGLSVAATWFLVVARKTAAYLWPHVGSALVEVVRIVHGETQSRRLFQGGAGQMSPPLERILGLVAVALVLLLIAFGLSRMRARGRLSSLAFLLGMSTLAYPASLALRFTQSGWAVGSRAMSFIYIGLALVLASGIESARGARRYRLGPVALTAVVTVVFVGGVIAGSTTNGRVATPYAAGAGRASINAEGVGAATWARRVLGPGKRMVADSTNSSLMGSYGEQRTLSAADGISVSWLFLAPEFGDYQRSMIADAGIEYVVVDRRIANVTPFQGYFFETWEKQVVDYGPRLSPELVARFDEIPEASRVFDSGNIQIYDVRGVGK